MKLLNKTFLLHRFCTDSEAAIISLESLTSCDASRLTVYVYHISARAMCGPAPFERQFCKVCTPRKRRTATKSV